MIPSRALELSGCGFDFDEDFLAAEGASEFKLSHRVILSEAARRVAHAGIGIDSVN